MDTTKVIGMREESLYRLNTLPVQALVHESTSMGEVWHMRVDHLNYRARPTLNNIVRGILVLRVDNDGTCRVCALGFCATLEDILHLYLLWEFATFVIYHTNTRKNNVNLGVKNQQ